MDDLRDRRIDLRARQPARARQLRIEEEAHELVAAAARQERLRRRHRERGVGERRRRCLGERALLAGGAAGVDPVVDEPALLGAQAHIVAPRVAWRAVRRVDRRERRHLAAVDRHHHARHLLLRIGDVVERERRDPAGAVTTGALLADDGPDLTVPGGDGRRRLEGGLDAARGDGAEDHERDPQLQAPLWHVHGPLHSSTMAPAA